MLSPRNNAKEQKNIDVTKIDNRGLDRKICLRTSPVSPDPLLWLSDELILHQENFPGMFLFASVPSPAIVLTSILKRWRTYYKPWGTVIKRLQMGQVLILSKIISESLYFLHKVSESPDHPDPHSLNHLIIQMFAAKFLLQELCLQRRHFSICLLFLELHVDHAGSWINASLAWGTFKVTDHQKNEKSKLPLKWKVFFFRYVCNLWLQSEIK
jgi:hypothetical protein